MQVFAACDRYPTDTRDTGMPFDVIRDGRFLEPEKAHGCQGSGRLFRRVCRPAHVGINHQWKLRPETFTHRPHPRNVLIQNRPTNLHFDGPEALREKTFALGDQFINREIQVDTAGVGLHLAFSTAEKSPQWLTGGSGLQIPQRDVDRGHCKRPDPAPADEVDLPPHRLPEFIQGLEVTREQKRPKIISDQGMNGRASDSVHRVGIAEALPSLLIHDTHGNQTEMSHLPVGCVRQGYRQGHSELLDQHVHYLQRFSSLSVSCEAVSGLCQRIKRISGNASTAVTENN